MRKTMMVLVALLAIFVMSGCDILEDVFGFLIEDPDLQVSNIQVTKDGLTDELIGVQFNIYVDGGDDDGVDAVEVELVINTVTSFTTGYSAYSELHNLQSADNEFYVSLAEIVSYIDANGGILNSADGPFYVGVRITLTEGSDDNSANNEDFSTEWFEMPDINID